MTETDQRVTCAKCSKKSTPRLWHLKHTIFTNRKIQHLCPYCGDVMYTSGGGISIIAVVLIFIFLVMPLSALFSNDNRHLKSEIARLESYVIESEAEIPNYQDHINKYKESTANGKNPQLRSQLGRLEYQHEKRLERIQEAKEKIEELKQQLDN